jgi:hypothetical protein
MDAFDHERLDVYRYALDLHDLVMAALPRRGHAVLRDQGERATSGIVLSIVRPGVCHRATDPNP